MRVRARRPGPFDGLRARLGVLVVLGSLLLALVGCTETPTVTRTGAPAPMAVPDDQTPAPNPDLAAAKSAAGIAACPATDSAPASGGLPDVTLECLGGGRSVRLADLRGPALVNVWASWCPGCRNEAPFLAEAGRSPSVRVLGVDHADPAPELAVQFAAQAGWTYPQLYDQDLAFRTRLQVTALPVTFFVRTDGTLAGRHAGPFTSSQQLDDVTRQYLGVTP